MQGEGGVLEGFVDREIAIDGRLGGDLGAERAEALAV